ncbi:DUF4403 family protein [Thermaurantiacus sp.]
MRPTCLLAPLLLALFALAGCGQGISNEPPPRATATELLPPRTSRVAMPVVADLDLIENELNRLIATRILSVDEKRKRCLPKSKVKFGCHLVGHVARGPIRISGKRDRLRLTMPLRGEIEARDVLGFIGTNEATGRTTVIADVQLALGPDWNPVPRVDISYRWEEEPGVRLARWRIRFTDQADKELAKLIADLERAIPQLVAQAHPKEQVESAWRKAHTTIELNRANPEVWMRVTPRGFGYGGYQVEGRKLSLLLEFEAGSETFVGARPPDPSPGPLPPLGKLQGAPGFRLIIPVVADWAVLERELEKALGKVAARGIPIEGVGRVEAQFGKPTLYATDGGRVAVGLPIRARTARGLLDTRGQVWLTGAVANEPDTQKLIISDLKITGDIAGADGRLLLAVAQAPAVREAIANELATNFARDFEKLLGKIDRALTDKRLGDFVLNARIAETRNGVIQPMGQGAYLLVEAKGEASLRWAPRPKGA